MCGLTYFTVRETLGLPNETGKERKSFFAPHRRKSFPVYKALIKPSGEWHPPRTTRPTVQHGLLHMQTNTNGQNAHKCLDPRGSLCLTGALSCSHGSAAVRPQTALNGTSDLIRSVFEYKSNTSIGSFSFFFEHWLD